MYTTGRRKKIWLAKCSAQEHYKIEKQNGNILALSRELRKNKRGPLNTINFQLSTSDIFLGLSWNPFPCDISPFTHCNPLFELQISCGSWQCIGGLFRNSTNCLPRSHGKFTRIFRVSLREVTHVFFINCTQEQLQTSSKIKSRYFVLSFDRGFSIVDNFAISLCFSFFFGKTCSFN